MSTGAWAAMNMRAPDSAAACAAPLVKASVSEPASADPTASQGAAPAPAGVAESNGAARVAPSVTRSAAVASADHAVAWK